MFKNTPSFDITTTYITIIGIPVAWLISDREDSVTMECYLRAVKLQSPTILINTAMTDDGNYGMLYTNVHFSFNIIIIR